MHVNMDETMIRLRQGGRLELVKLKPFADLKLFLDKEERGSLAERRQDVFCLLLYPTACMRCGFWETSSGGSSHWRRSSH